MPPRQTLPQSDEGRGARIQSGSTVEYARSLALLEDSHTQKEELKARLESECFNVLTPDSSGQCLELLEFGCRTFLLDVNMGPGRKIEGLEALQDIKRKCQEAFCAVVTGSSTYEATARKFGADLICGKAPDDIDSLIESLNELYLRLRFKLPEPLTLRKVGAGLRVEASEQTPEARVTADWRDAVASLKGLFQYVEGRLREQDLHGATRELVLMEPDLRRLLGLSGNFGDGYGIVVRALRNAILQHPGQELTEKQWATWRRVWDVVIAEPMIGTEAACRLATGLDEVGFNTEPPYWQASDRLMEAAMSSDRSEHSA